MAIPSVQIDSGFGLKAVSEKDDKFVIIKLTRTGSLAASLDVKYNLGGTATVSADYGNNITYSQTAFGLKSNAIGNTVTFDARNSEVFITIPILDDNIYEGKTPETIVFNLESTPSYDLVSDALQRTIQLNDNEYRPEIQLSTPGMGLDRKVSVVEGNSGEKRTIEFTAKMFNGAQSIASYESVLVDYTIQDGTTNSSDYTPVTGTLTFAPGEIEKKVSVEVLGDSQVEPDETFKVVFSNPRNDAIIIAPNAASGQLVDFNITIVNDDKQPTVTIAANKNASEAGEIGEFVITRDDVGIGDALTVKLETLTGADFTTIFRASATLSKLNVPLATPGEDYEAALPTSVTFAPGENKITLQVKAIDDLIPEDNQQLIISLVNDPSYKQGNVNAALRIIDNEIIPSPIAKTQKTAAEAGYKLSKLSTATGVTSIPGNYQIVDGNKVLWAEGKDIWFFDGTDKKKLDSDVLPATIDLSKNGAAWTKFVTETISGFNVTKQHVFFFNGATTIDIGAVSASDGSKPFDLAGDRIGYVLDGQVKVYNITTKETTVVSGVGGTSGANAAGIQLDPLGNGAVWYENPDVDGGSYYNQLKFYDGNTTVTLARTSDANGARKAIVSDGKVLYSTNVYTAGRTDLYLYDGGKTSKIAEGIEDSSANLNGWGIDGDRIYYQAILDDTNLPDGKTKPLTALRNYSISTGKTETVFDTTETISPFINSLQGSASNGKYTAWNYLQNSATSVVTGIQLDNGTDTISIKDPDSGTGRNEFSPVVAADGSLVFAVYDGKNNRSDLYLASKDSQFTPTNKAPIVANPIPDLAAERDKSFSFVVPINAFSDPENDTLTYSASQSNSLPLPTWLSFDPLTRTFSGTPGTGNEGTLEFQVRATDTAGNNVSDIFNLTVDSTGGTGGTGGGGSTIVPGLSLTSNLFQTDSTFKGFGITPISQKPTQKVSEIALFAVDDLSGKIGGIAPGAAGYLAAALGNARSIFSTLGGSFFSSSKRELALDPNKIYQALEIVDGSILDARQQLASGKTPNNLLFSLPDGNGNSPIKITNSSNGYNLSINNDELVLAIDKLAGAVVNLPIGAKSQSAPEGRTIDLSDYTGQTLKADLVTNSSAAYNNQVGFYAVEDASGKIKLGDGSTLQPGDANYAVEAIKLALTNSLQAGKTDTLMGKDIIGGQIYAPVVVAQGTFNDFVAQNPTNGGGANDIHAYFNYLGANSDRVDHFRLLGNNTFGVEDMYGGGDRDFNDLVIKMDLRV